MAKNLKIDMEEIAYLEDGELFHFMTRRFDRKQTVKHHMHSLAGMTQSITTYLAHTAMRPGCV